MRFDWKFVIGGISGFIAGIYYASLISPWVLENQYVKLFVVVLSVLFIVAFCSMPNMTMTLTAIGLSIAVFITASWYSEGSTGRRIRKMQEDMARQYDVDVKEIQSFTERYVTEQERQMTQAPSAPMAARNGGMDQRSNAGRSESLGPAHITVPENWEIEYGNSTPVPGVRQLRLKNPTASASLFMRFMPADPGFPLLNGSWLRKHEREVRSKSREIGWSVQSYRATVVSIAGMELRRLDYILSPANPQYPWSHTTEYYSLLGDQVLGFNYNLSVADYDTMAPIYEDVIRTLEIRPQ